MPDNSSLYGSSSSTTSSSNTSGLYGNSTSTTQTVASSNTTGLYADGLPTPSISGNVTIPGNLIINGCSIITNCTDTFNLINTNATGVNFAGAATTISIGAATGTTTINNGLFVDGPGEFASAITGTTANFATVNATTVDADNIIVDVIGPNDSIIAITDSGGTYATINPAGPTDATDLTTKAYVDSAVSGLTTDRLVNGAEQFVLNADGSITSPGNYNLAQATEFLYSENNDRLNRPGVQSTSGNTSGWRVSAPNATTSAIATSSVFSSSDELNGKYVNMQARGGATDPLRIATGEYVSGVLQASGESLAFRDGSNAAHATINPAGPTIATDLTTKTYVDSLPVVDTTYTIDASATTGGANFNLVGSDSTTDTIKFASGTNITVSQTDANTITIAATGVPDADKLVNGSYTLQLNSDGTVSFPNYTFPVADGTFDVGPGWGQVLATNGAGTLSWTDAKDLVPTYTTNVSPATGGVDVTLQAVEGASVFTVGTTTFLGGTNVTVSETSPNEITISATDTDTTYTIDASATTGGANLNLVGSDATTDTIKFAEGTGITVAQTDANTITVTNTGVITVNGQSGTAVLDTDDVAEGTTNLYYTDARARAALSAGTGITYDSGTGVISSSITQYTDADARAAVCNGEDLFDGGPGDVYVKSLRDTTRVKGSLEMTRDDNYVFPPTTNNWVVGNNGFDIASSTDGWLSSASTSLFLRDTFAYTSSGTGFAMRTADGTSATTGTNPWFGTPNTGPLQTPADALMGTINWNAYATGTPGSDWTNNFSTNSMGGGIRVNHALQLQAYTTEAPTTTTVTVTPLSQNARFTATVTGTSILTTKGVFSYTGTAPSPGQVIRIFGTPTGTGSIVGYTSPKIYYCVARDTTALTFTISETMNGLPVTTVAGTTTGLTIQRCGYAVNIASTSPIPYTNGSIVRVSGFGSQIPDGNYTVYQATNTVIGIGVYTTANPVITGSTKYEADTVVGGAGFRVRGFPDGTIWNNNTRTNFIDHKLSGATYTADSFTFQDASGAALPGGDISYSRSTLAVHNHSTIAPAAVDTIYDMTFDETPYISENISLVSNKQITFAVAGRYKIRFTGQAYNSGSNPSTTYVWLAKNGNGTGDQVADSAFDITILKSSGSGDSKQLIGMEWIVDVAANDYYIIQFASDSTSVSLVAETASTSPYTRPAVPSAQLKVEPVGA